MLITKRFNKRIIPLLIIMGPLLRILAPLNPYLVETLYSRGIYRFIGRSLSIITGILPFSLGEFIVILAFIFPIFITVYILVKLLKDYSNANSLLLSLLKKVVFVIGIIYFLFIFLWGLNYHRLPFSQLSNLETYPASKKELEDLCIYLINKTNSLREKVHENNEGIMVINEDNKKIFLRANQGYMAAAKKYSFLDGKFGRPKGVFFSKGLSYLGISGIYFPFTGEANVNVDIPSFMLPSIASHEMAHQRGFAREDEANYIAYLTCNMHPDIDFQYSGNLLALIHSMNKLYKYDKESYRNLIAKYDNGVKRDLNHLSSYWDSFEGPIEKTHTKINNAYLKSNSQEDGVYSYGRMVDLLIAEHRLRRGN